MEQVRTSEELREDREEQQWKQDLFFLLCERRKEAVEGRSSMPFFEAMADMRKRIANGEL